MNEDFSRSQNPKDDMGTTTAEYRLEDYQPFAEVLSELSQLKRSVRACIEARTDEIVIRAFDKDCEVELYKGERGWHMRDGERDVAITGVEPKEIARSFRNAALASGLEQSQTFSSNTDADSIAHIAAHEGRYQVAAAELEKQRGVTARLDDSDGPGSSLLRVKNVRTKREIVATVETDIQVYPDEWVISSLEHRDLASPKCEHVVSYDGTQEIKEFGSLAEVVDYISNEINRTPTKEVGALEL